MKKVFIRTLGCQMNERDFWEALSTLMAKSYEITEQKEIVYEMCTP